MLVSALIDNLMVEITIIICYRQFMDLNSHQVLP